MSNKYTGKCHVCGKTVRKGEGVCERIGGQWKVWCMDCYNESDNSGPEDRCCGDRAYEDRCAEACGYDNY